MNIDQIQIRNFPSVAKLFVGLFVTLMLCVVGWAGFIYVVQEGMIEESQIPVYSGGTATEVDLSKHDEERENEDERLEENVGLAHTHVNGQTLLFFALGLIFLFTTQPPRRKKLIFWSFAVAIVAHAIGLSGHGYHWFFNDILTISGIVLLIAIVYMVLMIYTDLGRKAASQ